MKRSTFYTLIAILILIIAAGAAYWYLFMRTAPVAQNPGDQTGSQNPGGFHPLGGNGGTGSNGGQTGTTGTSTVPGGSTTVAKLPVLRLLSSTPVGGYGTLVTSATTSVRWIDRGRGNVYEATYGDSAIATLSNTLVPRVYESAWSKDLAAFEGSLIQDGDMTLTYVYAQITKRAATATSSAAGTSVPLTPYELHGKNLPGSIIAYAASPDRTKMFTLMGENGSASGYVSSFNGTGAVRIFTTPLTQVNVAWPSDSIIAITTKGSAGYGGFLYFVNPKTGAWKKVLGPRAGLSASVSHDGKYVMASVSGSNGLSTFIYEIATGATTDAVVRTLADKCAWGNYYPDIVYCGVPSQAVSGAYPDGWYAGSLSTADKLWSVDAPTGTVHLLSSIIDQSDRVIDAYRLSLDSRDRYLFFMNKNDLSLWSLDLSAAQ